MTNSGRAASWTIRGQSMTLGLQGIEYQHIGALGLGPADSNPCEGRKILNYHGIEEVLFTDSSQAIA